MVKMSTYISFLIQSVEVSKPEINWTEINQKLPTGKDAESKKQRWKVRETKTTQQAREQRKTRPEQRIVIY